MGGMMESRLATALAVALTISSAFAGAQSPGSGPVLPAEERMLYARTVGDKRDEVEQRTRFVSDKGSSWYEATAHSSEQDAFLRLDPITLFASVIDVTSRGNDATLRRVTSVVESRGSPGPDEFLVSSFEALPYSLRAFPWGARQKARLSFLGSGGGNFRFDLAVIGKVVIAVEGRGVECWKAQLSLGGILGGFVGKSYLWYSVAYPHYLVKSEGASGPPGSPTTVLELLSYSSP
jgi:hypothetical protein